MRDSSSGRTEITRFPRIKATLGAAVLIIFCAAIPAQTAVRATPAGNHDAMLQFTAGGHIIGFQSKGLMVGAGDHGFKVSFRGARDVSPRADGLPTDKARPLTRVTYADLWDGVTLAYTAGKGIFESTYHISPDPAGHASRVARIRLRYSVPVFVDEAGNLVLTFKTGQMRESAPVAWQQIDGRRKAVEIGFRMIADREVGFAIGACRPDLALVIDPVLTWNTFLGGGGTDNGQAIAVDGDGNLFVAGYSSAAWGSPIRAHQGSYSFDAFVARLDSSGNLVWHTFLGGTGGDQGHAIAVDGDGNLFVAGSSSAAWGSPVGAHGGGLTSGVFVARLDSDGNLVWHTFLGGTGYAIAVDGDGNLFVAGSSSAAWGSPVRAYSADFDAFVARLDSDGNLVWLTFLGGTSYDRGNAIAVDGGGNLFVAGSSSAAWGSPVRTLSGGSDAFVARLDSSGHLVWHTFLGGAGHEWNAGSDYGNAIAVDGGGNLFVTGTSYSVKWGSPVGIYGGGGAFAARLDSDGNLVWHTFLGGTGHAIAVDGGNLFVAGSAGTSWGSPVRTIAGKNDAFVARLDSSGHLVWHAFFGGTSDHWMAGSDCGNAIAVDGDGNLFVTGASDTVWGYAYAVGATIPPVLYFDDAFVLKLPSAVLTVSTTGTGSGSVTSDPPGIDCGSVCRDLFERGVSITMTAVPDAGMGFQGWSGEGCAGSGDCMLTINEIHEVAAFFCDLSIDHDCDGVEDSQDAFPYDASESRDTDGDGRGDNADTDDDNDGVDDTIEAAAPNSGDGNNDGTADSLQAHVASGTAHGSSEYVILEAMDGATIIDCRTSANPSPDDAPAGIDFSLGFFSFTLTGVVTTDTRVKIHLPSDSVPETYYKYGPTPDDADDHWYEFLYDGDTGAEIDGNLITLHFIDARRGDDILIDDGMVVDIGGPGVGVGSGQTPSSSGSGGGGCFIGKILN